MTDEQLAQPGVAGTKTAMAFQGPDTNVTVAPTPRHIKFDPDYLPTIEDNRPYIPKKYLGKVYDTGCHKTPVEWSEIYGVDKVKILPRVGGAASGVQGLWGQNLFAGDVVELPVNLCMLLVNQRSAVFVLDSETAKDEKLIAELEQKGYAFATTVKPAREREEFQSVIARKTKTKSNWMAPILNPEKP
jgi:hypothetical protein